MSIQRAARFIAITLVALATCVLLAAYLLLFVDLFGKWGFPLAMIYQGIGGLLAVDASVGNNGELKFYKMILLWFLWPIMYFVYRRK